MTPSSLAEGFFRSCVALDPSRGARSELGAVVAWLSDRSSRMQMHVERIPFRATRAWRFERDPMLRLVHDTGRFFTVEGARILSRGVRHDQAILHQPEVGLLGFMMARFGDVPHLLVQVKWEPGNRAPQLSPTVQATHSNYTRAHGGRAQPYLDEFLDASPGSVVLDALMPEHGRYFLGKWNRNVVVEVDPRLPVTDSFQWVTLGQLKALLQRDDVVHMDTRSVIGALGLGADALPPLARGDEFARAVQLSAREDVHLAPIEGWLRRAAEEVRLEVHAEGLDEILGWEVTDDSICPRTDDPGFSVVAVRVEAPHREIASWCQPLIQPGQPGLLGLACRRDEGRLAFLVSARVEAGYGGAAHIFPTVASGGGCAEPFYEIFRDPPAEWVRCSVTNSEEGGRFFLYDNRFVILELPEGEALDVPPSHRWLTLGELTAAAKRGLVSMELRNVLAALRVVAGE